METNKLEVNLQVKIHGAFKNGSISVKIHRVDLGFVSTFHKIQSFTLNEVILCIRKRCFKPSLTFNMLLMALTRVVNGDNMRILNVLENENLDYLKSLSYNEDLEIWLNGFDEEGNWNAELSKNYLQNKRNKLKEEIKCTMKKRKYDDTDLKKSLGKSTSSKRSNPRKKKEKNNHTLKVQIEKIQTKNNSAVINKTQKNINTPNEFKIITISATSNQNTIATTNIQPYINILDQYMGNRTNTHIKMYGKPIKNIGNTCWLSSIINIFVHCKSLTNILSNIIVNSNQYNDKDKMLFSTIFQSIYLMLPNISFNSLITNSDSTCLDPTILQKTWNIHQTNTREMYCIDEALNEILNFITKDISENFVTKSFEELVCINCNERRRGTNAICIPHYVLQLESSSLSIQDKINKYFHYEERIINCTCGNNQIHLKYENIQQFANSLIIHLKNEQRNYTQTNFSHENLILYNENIAKTVYIYNITTKLNATYEVETIVCYVHQIRHFITYTYVTELAGWCIFNDSQDVGFTQDQNNFEGIPVILVYKLLKLQF